MEALVLQQLYMEKVKTFWEQDQPDGEIPSSALNLIFFIITETISQVGLSAVDPLINDSDLAASNTNIAGYKTALRYNLGKATILTLTYQYVDNLRQSLGKGLNGIAGPGGTNSNQIIQADLDIKF